MKTQKTIYEFTDENASFRVSAPERTRYLYFPLVNEMGLMSAIGPRLQGDTKLDQHSFLTLPQAVEDLHETRSSRNFWLSFPGGNGKRIVWSAVGQSAWQKSPAGTDSPSTLDAGLLWHKVSRGNKSLGVETIVTSFVPVTNDTVEIMKVEVRNVTRKPLSFTPTAAVPLFGRSADNLRDHRHVTSLLHRLKKDRFGVSLKPTMSFNERGHSVNDTTYFVAAADGAGRPPAGVFPTVLEFAGEAGDLEAPQALIEGRMPRKSVGADDQGKEAMAALQFAPVRLSPGATAFFIVVLGIAKGDADPTAIAGRYLRHGAAETELARNREHWGRRTSQIVFRTGDPRFNRWARWVSTQPTFRKLFGCSFLPDFDYGRGGRGWRDLWQDCLALLLADPADVRDDIVRNYGGVRIDGSNATIIGRQPIRVNGRNGEALLRWKPEFIADRNNIARTWMDHGIWPFLTTRLYLNQTGDWDLLLEPVPYFRDPLTHRGKRVNRDWAASEKAWAGTPDEACKLRTAEQKTYLGSVLEHILVQTVVQFFNVGEHNNIRLEDADWNDGLDMGHEKGESVAFTALYGGNLESLAATLETAARAKGWADVQVFEELLPLLDRLGDKVNYDRVEEKRKRLMDYFDATVGGVKGTRARVPVERLAADLREKAAWIKAHLNRNEWISPDGKNAWFNGYYDNAGARVEGRRPDGRIRMTLTGQVFPIMAGIADRKRVGQVIRAVDTYLWDKSVGGIRLNTDFGSVQPALGRAFSFAFGEKENGAVFSHMVVMYANALYQQGFAKDGFRALHSLYLMASGAKGRIYPGLPEYFNNEGRGRYMYLTGSASWYVLTLLTQAFGVRGEAGDLLLAPRLDPGQFDRKKEANVELYFAGTRLKVVYLNPRLTPADRATVKSVRDESGPVPFEVIGAGARIRRGLVEKKGELTLFVEVGAD